MTKLDRKHIEDALAKYAAQNYKEQTTKTLVHPTSDSSYDISLTCINRNFLTYTVGAFWTVEWQSEFHLNTVTNQISGQITARTHYLEQMNNFEQKVKHTCEPKILAKSDADSVVEYIEMQELQMHSDLEEAHE